MDTPASPAHATSDPGAGCTTAEAVAGSDKHDSLQSGGEHASEHASEQSLTSAEANAPSAPVAVDEAPLFWARHGRNISSASYQSLTQPRAAGISLEDHSEEDNVLGQACWARSVVIDEYNVVSGPTGVGAYVVWHCAVSTLEGGDVHIRKRYSEFDHLRADLVRAFPHADAMIPQLPRKSIVSRFRPVFLEQRRAGLSHFLNCILLNPEFAASPILKDFIFA